MPHKLQVRFMWLNAENLFLMSDTKLMEEHLSLSESQWQKLSSSIFENKPLRKTKMIADIILKKCPDIVALAEVGGLESLENFNRLFLKDLYTAALVEGNSDRNIDLGFLVKKGVPFFFDLVSNRHRPLNFWYAHEIPAHLTIEDMIQQGAKSQLFSRDIPELHLFLKDKDHPCAVVLAAHLKSRLDPANRDPNGTARRKSECRVLVDIYLELEKRFQEKVPIVVLGDFNGNATLKKYDPEFADIYQRTGWQDVGELAHLEPAQRATYYQVQRGHPTEGKQIDYAFLSPLAANGLDLSQVEFYKYRDEYGLISSPPASFDAKLSLPSDHDPIFFALNLQVD